MADPKQAAQVTRNVNVSDSNPSIGWGDAVNAAVETRAAEIEASRRQEPYKPAASKPLPKVKPSVGPTQFPSKKPAEPVELKPSVPVVEPAAAVEPVEPPPPTEQPKPLPIDTWVSAGMRAALSTAQQRGSRQTTPEEAVAAARKRIDEMAKTEGKTFDDYVADAKRRGISLTSLVDDSARGINERWSLSQAAARQTSGMVKLPSPSGPSPVTFDVGTAEKEIKDKLYGQAKARGVDINATSPKILTATELRGEAAKKMSGEKSGFMGNPETSQDAEVSKPGEVGAQTADLIIAEMFSRDSDGTMGQYIQSLQNNPGGFEIWVAEESEKLLKKRGVRPGDANFTEQQRKARAQAANEVFAMKTGGLWTAPIFVNRDLMPDNYWDAFGPSLEVVGYGNEVVDGKPVVVQRSESWNSWFLNALDSPQYAAVGIWDAMGEANRPGESTFDSVKRNVIDATAGRRDIFKAVTESEGFQARQVYNPDGSLAVDENGEPLTEENWRPWVYGSVGLAASVIFPDAGDLLIFPTLAKIGKGITTITEAKRADKGAEILTQIAASRTAAKAQFEESLALADEAAQATDQAIKAEKTAASLEARRQANALFESASAHERRLFAEQEGLAKHLDDTDGDAHKQMTHQAAIDSANIQLARTIVDRAEALENVHPAIRKPLKSVQGAASKAINVGRKDLYDTQSQLARAEASFKNVKRLPDTRNAVLEFVSQPELSRLKDLLPEEDFKELMAELPNAVANPQQFINLAMQKRLKVNYPAGITAASPAGHAWRQKIVSDGAAIARKAKNIDTHVAEVERRVYAAILNNSESRAVAADTLANVLRKEGPRNIPSIDKVPDLGDPTLKLAGRDIDASVEMTEGAKKLVSQLRSSGLTKKQSMAIASLMDTRARTWAWKTGGKAEDWYKVGNADRISFVKEQAANIPTLQRGTAEFLFEGGADATNTPEFKRWFGKSKAVNRSGKPTVVYHATNYEFDAFKPGLIYTTQWPEEAAQYGQRVIPMYARAENPVTLADEEWRMLMDYPERVKALKARGYDSAYSDDTWDLVLFSPEQAKSVDNRGTFDPNDPRISYRREPVIDLKSPSAASVKAELENALKSAAEFKTNTVKLPVGENIPLSDALASIAKSDKRPAFQLIAQRMSESIRVEGSYINVVSGPMQQVEKALAKHVADGGEHADEIADILKRANGDIDLTSSMHGLAFTGGELDGRIKITLPEVSGTADVPAMFVLHEAVHIVTTRWISATKVMTQAELAKVPVEVKQAVDRLNDIFRQVSAAIKASGDPQAIKQYGLLSANEFIAEAVANPNFQNILKGIKVSGAEKSIWSHFVDSVAKLLGITKDLNGSALAETLTVFDRILTATSGPSFIKAVNANADIEKMETELIRLERIVAQNPKKAAEHGSDIRELKRLIAKAKRDEAKAAEVSKAPDVEPSVKAQPNVSRAKAHLEAMRKAEADAQREYADALIAKRASPKDKALKEAADVARAKLAKAMSDVTDAERAAKVEIRAETKALQAAELEDPEIKQAYARVRAAERKVNETKDAIEKSKLAMADAVRNKNGAARKAAEREIATLEAALGTFETSYQETREVYKRLSDEFRAKKAAEAAAETAPEVAPEPPKVEPVVDPEGTAVVAKPTQAPTSQGGLPVSTGPSKPADDELLDLDPEQTGTATQVATGPGWPTGDVTPPLKAATGPVAPPTPPASTVGVTPPPASVTPPSTPSVPPASPPVPPAPPSPPTPPVGPASLPATPPPLPKGAVAFYNDGSAIIYSFEKADFNTFVHEIGHVIRRDLIDEEREAMRAWLSVEAGKPVEIDNLGNFVDPTTGLLFNKADSDALEELFTERFVNWMATAGKDAIKETSNPIFAVFESIKGWMLDAFKALKATMPSAVSKPVDEFFTGILSVGKDPNAVSEAFAAAKRVTGQKRGFIRGMIGPDSDFVDLYVYEELAKGAKAGGLNVTPAQLEKVLETNGSIEFPRPVLGRTKYNAEDIAHLQKDLEEGGTTELYRSAAKLVAGDLAKSITEESTIDKLWNMLRDEPLNYDTIADPTKPRNPVVGFAKAVARAGAALYIGLDEMADLRHLPPAVRQIVLSGVRVINSVYHDALKLAEERDLPKLLSYLTGQNVKFHNGRRVMTASWDAVSSVQMRLKDILEAGGAAVQADLHVLTHAPDFSNLNKADSEAVQRAAEFVLNTTSSMYIKQLLQVLGASQPMNKAYDAVNAPKELILAKQLVIFAYSSPLAGVTRFHDVTSKLYGESNGVKALVLMAAHGQADRVRKTWFNAGIAISSTDAALFKSWLNAEYVPDSAMPTIKRIADTLGLNPTFVPALDAIGRYDVPAAAYDRLTSALAKANPEKQHWLMKSESDTAGSSGPMAALQAWVRWRKSSMVRGSLLVRSRLLTSNSMDLILMVGNNLGLGVAVAASGRVASQTLLALAPGVTRAIDVASRMGWAKPEALETVRDAIQKGGDNFAGYVAKSMWKKAVSLDVNKLLSGERAVFNMGGKVYSWSDLRQIAIEEGVFDSLPASIDSAIRKSVRAPVTPLEKAGDKLASYGEYVSDVQEGVAERERAGLMLTLMEMGINPRIAARLTVSTMFDYVTTVAAKERSMIISLFEPFWPFIKNSGRGIVNNFFTGYGAYRIGLLRRASERSFDAINELVYDMVADPYGVDTSALSDEGRDNYFEMRRIIESKYGGVEKVPLNVKLSIGSVFAGQTSYFLHDGKVFALKSRIGEIASGTDNNNKLSPYIERLGLPARLDIEDAVIPRPDRSSTSSFYRDLYAMTIPVTMTKQTQRYMELAAPDHPFIEFLMPETYVQTTVRRMGGLTALAVLGAYGLFDAATGLLNGAGPTDGEMEGLNWTRAGNITEQVLDPERSLLLPQVYGLLFDDDSTQPYRIHPILAKALTTIGVSHLSVNAAQDPFAVTFDTAAPTPTEVSASAEAVSQNLLPGQTSPDLGAAVTTTRHYLPAHWGVIIQSIPDLDGLNRELLRYNDAADLRPGSGPMERSADPLYPILASAYRVITGLSTAEPHRSKTALREEPRRDTTTTNPVK